MLTWWRAVRPHTLLLSIGPILLGSALAVTTQLNPIILVLSLLTAVLLQTLTNIANDLGDTEKGVDRNRPEPQRQIQTGEISKQQARLALLINTLLCGLSGILLIHSAKLLPSGAALFLSVGGAAILAAIFYTLGAKPYGYRGLGDLSVFLFFGLTAVLGTCYLQAGMLSPLAVLPATAAGLLSVSVLNINNIRDIEFDRQAGKITLAMKLGKPRALTYFSLCWILAMAATFIYLIAAAMPLAIIPILLTPLFIRLDRQLRRIDTFNSYNQALAQTVKLTFAYELLFTGALLLTHWNIS